MGGSKINTKQNSSGKLLWNAWNTIQTAFFSWDGRRPKQRVPRVGHTPVAYLEIYYIGVNIYDKPEYIVRFRRFNTTPTIKKDTKYIHKTFPVPLEGRRLLVIESVVLVTLPSTPLKPPSHFPARAITKNKINRKKNMVR